MDARPDYELWIVNAYFSYRGDLDIAKMAKFETVRLQGSLNRIRSGVRRTHGTLQEAFIQVVTVHCFERQGITIHGLHTSA